MLIEITGDQSAPLAVIRLWAHCQNQHRSFFPDMTPAQLASVCHWGERKPACHVAMVKAGFVDKLKPKGYAAHEWAEHNRQLLQKWAAGQKGGRPPLSENANELPLFEKPTDNRPLTGTKPDRSDRSDRPDRPDRSEKIDPTDQMDRSGSERPEQAVGRKVGINAVGVSDTGGLEGLVGSITSRVISRAGRPTLAEALAFGKRKFEAVWDKAEAWVRTWYATMDKQHWLDRKRKPIANWQRHLQGYVDTAWREDRGIR